MSVVCIANLKGGVGKTSLAVNTSHALALKGCETLVIDLDPQGGATHLLSNKISAGLESFEDSSRSEPLLQKLLERCMAGIEEVRPSLFLLPLSQMLGNRGVDINTFFSRGTFLEDLICELSQYYDYVVVDTPPVWTALMKSAVAAASLMVVPVDPSAMSVKAAVQLLQSTSQDYSPYIALVRTFVSRQAKRVTRRSLEQLHRRFPEGEYRDVDTETPLPRPIGLKGVPSGGDAGLSIFLSQSPIYRTEVAHQLSFDKRTAFDRSGMSLLRKGYIDAARDIETLLGLAEYEVETDDSLLASMTG